MFAKKTNSGIFDHKLNNSAHVRNLLTKLDRNSDFFMTNEDRFNIKSVKNTRRSFSKKNENFFLNRKKLKDYKRSNKIFNEFEKFLEKDRKKFKDKFKNRQEKGLNCELMGYNPITLKYFKNKKGNFLEKIDKQNNLKNIIRAKNLEYQTSLNFDLINGKKRNLVKVSDDILDRYKDQFNIPKRKVRVYKYDFHL